MAICNNCKSHLSCKTKIGLIITACGLFKSLITNNENEQKKSRIIHNIEIGKGGPDVAGMKKMYGYGYTSSLAENAKKKLSNG